MRSAIVMEVCACEMPFYFRSPWATKNNNHTKCTFYGIDLPDFDAATDDELRSFLGT